MITSIINKPYENHKQNKRPLKLLKELLVKRSVSSLMISIRTINQTFIKTLKTFIKTKIKNTFCFFMKIKIISFLINSFLFFITMKKISYWLFIELIKVNDNNYY